MATANWRRTSLSRSLRQKFACNLPDSLGVFTKIGSNLGFFTNLVKLFLLGHRFRNVAVGSRIGPTEGNGTSDCRAGSFRGRFPGHSSFMTRNRSMGKA